MCTSDSGDEIKIEIYKKDFPFDAVDGSPATATLTSGTGQVNLRVQR